MVRMSDGRAEMDPLLLRGPGGASTESAPRTVGEPVALGGRARSDVLFGLRGVAKRFGSFEALRPLTLTIRAGERVAIIGPSGAGKTTLLRLLNTSLAASAGALSILGVDPTALSAGALRSLRARIGTIYQQLLLIPQVSVLQNVIAGRLAHLSLGKAAWSLISSAESSRVRAILDSVGIGSRIYERVDRLSGGEQQRVAIARALYQEPDVLIADEPVSSVDPTHSVEILQLLTRVPRTQTLVISTHRLESLLPWVSRVIGLRQGRLLFDKASSQVSMDDLARLYESEKAKAIVGAARAISPAASTAQGAVFLGASNTPGELILPAIVPVFVRERPGVHVSLALKDTSQTRSDVLAGSLDLAFVGAREPHPDLCYEHFADDEIVLVAAPNLALLPADPLTASALASLPRVERTLGSGTRTVVEDYFANMGAPLDPSAVALEVGTLVGLKAAVISGVGVAFVSRRAVSAELRSGVLKELPIQSARIRRRIFALWRIGGLTPQAKGFLEVARRTWRPEGEGGH
jgi:phosphonate transport system ATP-binding protein